MLNWIALWIGVWLFSLDGPLQTKRNASLPVSEDVVEGAKLPVFWGDPILQGLHIGIFIALFAVAVFWFILNRSTIGYEVRAVGFNPEAARYSGMSVGKNYIFVMALCGLFAGLAGAMDVLGWQFRVATNDIQVTLRRLLRDSRGAARAATRRWAPSRPASCSGRSSAAPRSATSTRRSSSRRWPRT